MHKARIIMTNCSADDRRLVNIFNNAITAFYSHCSEVVGKLKKMIASRELVEIDASVMKDRVKNTEADQSYLLEMAGRICVPRTDTYAMLEVGTHHITEDDSNILAYMSECNVQDNDASLNVGNLGYGYAVMLTVDPEYEGDIWEVRDRCREEGNNLSDSFWNILNIAKIEGYRCVYIDRDVDTVIKGIEVHDW